MSARAVVALLGLVMATACATPAPTQVEFPPPQAALCSPGVSLGKVVVAPITRWRLDQKEAEVREGIAQRAIAAVAPAIPCADSVSVVAFVLDADASAQVMKARLDHVSTMIFVRIDELGPIAILSFPTIWSTWSDVKFTLDAVDVQSGETLRSIPHHRRKGGAYEGRGLAPLQSEMEQALKDVILGA